MFINDDSIKNLTPSAASVWEIYGSVNQPIIALPDRPPEPTWAYVIALKDDERIRVYIHLFREQNREGVFYISGDGDVEFIDAEFIFNEALDFTGSMGFIMEKIELGDTAEQREERIKAVPAFMTDLKDYKPHAEDREAVPAGGETTADTHDTAPTDGIMKDRGGKQWLASILSLF